MIAPILIASIEGARWLWTVRRASACSLALWLLACAYVTNVAWSPSPIGNAYGVWRRDDAHAEALRDAVDVIPDDAVGVVVVQHRAAPVPPARVVRLAEPVLAGVLGQQRHGLRRSSPAPRRSSTSPSTSLLPG